jgi:uncharacterized protein (DUF111 family)
VDRVKPEFDDLARIAEKEGIAVGEIGTELRVKS